MTFRGRIENGVSHTGDELDCGADALRRFEQSGKNLNLWAQLPNATRKKWREKVKIILDAIERERNRAANSRT